MSVLDRIFEQKAAEVISAKQNVALSDLKMLAHEVDAPRGFQRALASVNGLALVAEVKKASPSRGVIRENFDPGAIAMAYERAGATALSILTDEPNFGGSAENLKIAKTLTQLPCLRKDFINDPYQVYEARAWGADAVLLIVAALSRTQIEDLRGLIEELGMDALVEVHSEPELEIAIELKCPMIGVNNRNLKDMETSISVSRRLLPAVKAIGSLGISESALKTRADLDVVEAAGAKAVLIGTSFCSAPDVEDKVREVMGW